MGDYNTRLMKNDLRPSLTITSKVYNLEIIPLNASHSSHNTKPSLLDMILASTRENVVKHGQYPADMFLYHNLLFITYKIRPPKFKS